MSRARDFVESFSALRHVPRAFWFVIAAFVIDSAAYFGVLTLMTTYLSGDLGWSDGAAGITVSVFTMMVTLLMLGAGSYAEGFGLRRAILFALVLTLVGRILYSLGPSSRPGVLLVALVLGSLLMVALGEAILQPCAIPGSSNTPTRGRTRWATA